MALTIPSDLAPENYPLAWLLGSWRGGGVLEYGNIPAAAYLHEVTIDNEDAGPYLRLTSTIWLAEEPAEIVDKERPGISVWSDLSKDRLWSSVMGFIRVNPEAAKREDGSVLLEAMMASPSGTSQIWVGLVRGPQLQMVTDVMARSAAGADVTAAKILAGSVNSDLMYAYDMEAFGYPMRSYLAGRLSRVE